jgi:hypothetical protein
MTMRAPNTSRLPSSKDAPEPRRVPELKLEQLAAGTLPGAAARLVEESLRVEPGGVARLAALRADTAATLVRHPKGEVLAEVERRAAARPIVATLRSARLRWSPVLVVALAAALAVVVDRSGDADDASDFMSKGLGASVRLHSGSARGPTLADGQRVPAGETVVFEIAGAGRKHAVLASFDARGRATLHFPEDTRAATAIGRDAFVLPQAYVLDDAPFDRFVLFTSDTPLDVAALLEAVRAVAERSDARSAAPAVPVDVGVFSVVLDR